MSTTKRPTGKLALAAVLAVAGLLVTGCGAGNTTAAAGTSAVNLADPANAVAGGTLKIAKVGDFSALDPLIAYAVDDWGVMRATQRQLVTYAGSPTDIKSDTQLVGDLAEKWTVSDDGLVYTFTLKDDIHFTGAADREITAEDFVYQIKRFPDPNKQVAAINYFNSAIKGFEEFSEKFRKEVKPGDPAASYKFQQENEIEGVKALDSKTLQFTLTGKAYDFLGILSMGFVSPQPAEVVSQYTGDSLDYRQHYVSSGAYAVTEYTPDQKLVLTKDADYNQASDPRKNYADEIVIDTTSDSAATAVQKVQTGDAHFSLQEGVPPITAIQQYVTKNSPYIVSAASGSESAIGFNLQPNATTEGQKAIRELKVRQAIAYAANKANLVQNRGGEIAGSPTGQIITSTILGYEKFDPYATEGSKGDPEKAKQLLAEAGYPDGITLNTAYRSNEASTKEATSLQEDLAKANITLNLVPVNESEFHGLLQNEPEKYDIIANLVYAPDWQGDSTRMILGGWLNSDVSPCGPGNVYGICYDNPELNKLASEAFASDTPGPIWTQADQVASTDLAWVPVYERNAIFILSEDVTYYQWSNLATGPDPTGIAVKH
ncbi:ABC transporter substrate-binding protein [Arthrobacter ginkgonis]|uniref:ABC transporter substrate-binding protein n=1 Tax=Arthrobacter ginkgonis TaxID=1630594 RepID=A0ABP7C9P0_9MICC